MTDLLREYKRMADGGQQFRGLNILQHAKQIAGLADVFTVKTVLDYGSGAGDQWRSPHKLADLIGVRKTDVTLYDPSFQHHIVPDRKFDMVLCSDVLEHVPGDVVDEFIDSLFAHASKVVWASVCCRPAKKSFPDGTNLHVSLHALQWWYDTFADASAKHGVSYTLVETP